MPDLTAILARQRAFSLRTFGPDYRPQQTIDHIVRELERASTAWQLIDYAPVGKWVLVCNDGIRTFEKADDK